MPSPQTFGPYELTERINVGGMAEVFRARDVAHERLVAIKRILPSVAEDEEFIQMFRDEAAIASQLDHPNIARIYDVGRVDLSYYLALEFVRGKDLRIIFDRGAKNKEPIPLDFILYVISQACRGLDYAHHRTDARGKALGVVHRDVSPQNVLVSFDGEVKIIDFGIAKASGKVARTQVGTIKGKFGYMSPEQVRGLPIDQRSDVFSLGICLWELLTLQRLFVGDNEVAIMEKIRRGEVPDLAAIAPETPLQVEQIVRKALANDVDERYPTATELDSDITAFARANGLVLEAAQAADYMRRIFAGDPAIDASLEEGASMADQKTGSDLDVFDGLLKKNPPPADDEAPTPFAPHVASNIPNNVKTVPPPPLRRATLVGMPNPIAGGGPGGNNNAMMGGTPSAPPSPSTQPGTGPWGPSPTVPTSTGVSALPVPIAGLPTSPMAMGPMSGDGDMDWEEDEKTTIFEKNETTTVFEARSDGNSARSFPAPPPSGLPPPQRRSGGMGSIPPPPPGPPPTGRFSSTPPPLSKLPNAARTAPMGVPAARPLSATRVMTPDFSRSGVTSVVSAISGPQRGKYLAAVVGALLAASAFAFVAMPRGGKIAVFVSGVGSRSLSAVNISVDGVQKCTASPCNLELDKGIHAIKASADGYTPQEQGTTLRSGDEIALNFKLNKASEGTGFKVSGKQDGVELFIDGKEIGPLPQELKDLEPGLHKVLLKGSDRYAAEERSVTVEGDELKDLGVVALKVLRGLATFDVRTPGVKVTLVSGRDRRQLTDFSQPVEIETSKNWTIEATKPGYDDLRQPITFEDRAEKVFVIALNERSGTASGTAVAERPERVERAERPSVAAVAAAPAPRSRPPAEPRPAPPPSSDDDTGGGGGGNCTLNFNSIPVSNVLFDGRPLGGTPRLGVSAAPGTHTVIFVSPEEGKKSMTVSCKSGETKTVAARLSQQ
ncbi:MAG TPA: protein kinase [Polyangiaceae bacterium]|nr:protein kinase [Polyangiaceae bacterium]